MFNKDDNFITTGQYLDVLKIARVTPIYKKGFKMKLSNNRPIAILSPFNKIFETIIKQRLLNFGRSTKFLLKHNLALEKTFLLLWRLPIFVNIFFKSELDSNKNICSIFMDFTKAFDTVNHDILLYKLN